MKKIQLLFGKAVNYLEEYDLPIIRYVFLFFAILFLRLCLEFFANQKLFTFYDALHIGLWFTFIVLTFIIQLHLFSKVQLIKVMKLSICCFSIALIAPIIDLIISQGKFAKMNYLSIQSFSDFVFSYLTIGGANMTRGATIGIRLEIVLLMIASFNYIYVKRKKISSAIIGAFCIYTVLFLSGIIPFAMNYFIQLNHLEYATDDHSTELLLFTLDLILLLIIVSKLRISNPIKMNFRSIISLLFCLGAFVIGALEANKNYPENWSLNATTIFYFPILLLFFGIVLNYINTKNQHIKSNSSPANFHLENGFVFLIFIISSMLSFYVLFAVLLMWSMLFIIYEKPTQFIKIKWLSIFSKSIFYVTFLFLGFLVFGAPLIGINSLFLICLLSIFFLLELSLTFFWKERIDI